MLLAPSGIFRNLPEMLVNFILVLLTYWEYRGVWYVTGCWRWVVDVGERWSECKGLCIMAESCQYRQVSVTNCHYWHTRHCWHTVITLVSSWFIMCQIPASPIENWRRPPGCPCTTWTKTIQQDLTSNNLSLSEAVDVAQNRPLWRLMSMFGATHS